MHRAPAYNVIGGALDGRDGASVDRDRIAVRDPLNHARICRQAREAGGGAHDSAAARTGTAPQFRGVHLQVRQVAQLRLKPHAHHGAAVRNACALARGVGVDDGDSHARQRGQQL